MNIMLVDYVCSPNQGSEAYCGWSWALYFSKIKNNFVFLLIRPKYFSEIEKYLEIHLIKNIVPICVEVPEKFLFLYKHFYLQYINYTLWEIKAYFHVKKFIKSKHIDIIHHVTLGDFRMLGFWPFLKIPYVFGPVGGGQTIPKKLKKYARCHQIEESFRTLFNYMSIFNPFYIIVINMTKKIYVSNDETKQLLSKVLINKSKLTLLTENGVDTTSIDTNITKKTYNNNKSITLLWAGRMIYRKGLHFLLDVVAQIDTNRDFKLLLCGTGKEMHNLAKKVKELKIEQKVFFLGEVEKEKMPEIYKQSDIFVFPSLRETTGTVLLEAMSFKQAIVSFNQNGAKQLVNEDSGFLINTKSENIVEEWVDKIKLLIENDDIRLNMGENAQKCVFQKFNWNKKTDAMYREFINILSNDI
jgi:glycosyltransferase involved in cell wall biosynthesis